jgi:hypothetical protein
VKLTKEILDRVRNMEGFPLGEDEDIIELSDPPYFTACPNPFIGEFMEKNGTPYDEVTDEYKVMPYTADVSEGKNDPIYNAHSYHTKVPHKAINCVVGLVHPATLIFHFFEDFFGFFFKFRYINGGVIIVCYKSSCRG